MSPCFDENGNVISWKHLREDLFGRLTDGPFSYCPKCGRKEYSRTRVHCVMPQPDETLCIGVLRPLPAAKQGEK